MLFSAVIVLGIYFFIKKTTDWLCSLPSFSKVPWFVGVSIHGIVLFFLLRYGYQLLYKITWHFFYPGLFQKIDNLVFYISLDAFVGFFGPVLLYEWYRKSTEGLVASSMSTSPTDPTRIPKITFVLVPNFLRFLLFGFMMIGISSEALGWLGWGLLNRMISATLSFIYPTVWIFGRDYTKNRQTLSSNAVSNQVDLSRKGWGLAKKGWLYFFLLMLVSFLLIALVTKSFQANRVTNSNIDTLPPISTSDTPPRVTPPKNAGTPRTNQPTPIDPRMVPPNNRPGVPMLPPGNAPSNSPDNTYAAQGAAIREYLLGFTNFVRRCRAAGGTVQSGGGGAPLCSNDSTLFWPTLSLCGQNASDTFFTVLRGDSDNWDFTVTCRDFPACNGPENALCSAQGCVFGGTCAAR